VLEEPPEFATIFILTPNAGELLPTIRSRCITFTLSALPTEEVAQYLAEKRPEWNVRQRQLVARLSGGAIGKAQNFDLPTYTAGRADALLLLHSAVQSEDHTALFKITETYRAGAEGKEKTDQLIRAVYSLLEDLLFIRSDSEELVRNTDLLPELKKLAAQVEFDWIARASQKLGQVESGMRRNLLRSLSLDAFATAIEK
jgi:DNA polymerase-3 subunit delta'